MGKRSINIKQEKAAKGRPIGRPHQAAGIKTFEGNRLLESASQHEYCLFSPIYGLTQLTYKSSLILNTDLLLKTQLYQSQKTPVRLANRGWRRVFKPMTPALAQERAIVSLCNGDD
ncbi:hypothetical protein [Polaromonas vacuolata]|uniref:hypothetical protein n=1 Tax=Polaromonas vacuolata TaxID=37448 RepID=UPI001457332A|nr:hypothetical protein [Polaromonas vacuolata]